MKILYNHEPLTKSLHEIWPELADYFLAAFDWFGGGSIGKIANNK